MPEAKKQKPKPKHKPKPKPKPRPRPDPKFLIIDGCPCPFEVAPQVYMVLRRAGQTASSIYRGEDAKAILHHLGKHTQGELYWLSEHGTPAEREAAGLPAGGGGVNREGRSEHECKSDGVGKAGPPGRDLPRWQVGVDSGTNTDESRAAITSAGAHFGWVVAHHYDAGVERHHWCFDEPPRPSPATKHQIARLAATLPRR